MVKMFQNEIKLHKKYGTFTWLSIPSKKRKDKLLLGTGLLMHWATVVDWTCFSIGIWRPASEGAGACLTHRLMGTGWCCLISSHPAAHFNRPQKLAHPVAQFFLLALVRFQDCSNFCVLLLGKINIKIVWAKYWLYCWNHLFLNCIAVLFTQVIFFTCRNVHSILYGV